MTQTRSGKCFLYPDSLLLRVGPIVAVLVVGRILPAGDPLLPVVGLWTDVLEAVKLEEWLL